LTGSAEAFLGRHGRDVFWLGLAAACAGLITRDPSRLFHPRFWAEDGVFWYHDAYTYGAVSLLWPLTGYLQSLPRLVALAAQPFPLVHAPLLFCLASLAIQLAPVGLLLSARAAAIIPSATARLLLAAFYVGMPNSGETFLILTDADWHLAILSCLLIILPAPRTAAARYLQYATLLIGGLSGPFCLFLAPIAWWHVLTTRRDRGHGLVQAVLISGAAVLQFLIIIIEGHLQGQRHFAPLGASLPMLASIVTGQVLLGGLIGTSSFATLAARPVWAAGGIADYACALIGLAIILLAVIRGNGAFRKFLVFATLIIASALASPTASVSVPQWDVLNIPGVGSRYWIIPILAWFCSVLVLAAQPSLWRWPARLLLAAFIIGMVADWQYPSFQPTGFDAAARAFAHAPPGTVARFPENPNPSAWIMTLTKKS
jgi:hypothetical protein